MSNKEIKARFDQEWENVAHKYQKNATGGAVLPGIDLQNKIQEQKDLKNAYNTIVTCRKQMPTIEERLERVMGDIGGPQEQQILEEIDGKESSSSTSSCLDDESFFKDKDVVVAKDSQLL